MISIKKYMSVIALAAFITACNNTKSNTHTEKETVQQTTVAFKDEKLKNIYTAYLKLKDNLVKSNAEDAKKAALALSGELTNFNGCENAAQIAALISNSTDLKEQRKQFTALNIELIPMFKHTELTAGTIYVQHCPMANKGDGGDWLSSEKKIQNPYYGDEMLECGAVTEEIKTK